MDKGLVAARAALNENGNQGYSWGLKDLDHVVGRVRKGQLIIIGAKPSNGKTTFLVNWLNFLYSAGTRVVFLGTEVDPSVLYLKWAALRFGYDEDAVLAHEWNDLPAGAKGNLLSELRIFSYHIDRIRLPSCLHPHISDVLDEIQAAREDGAGIVIFDHLHRILPRRGQGPWDALTEAALALKNAANDGIAVVVAAQLRRDGDGIFDKYRPPYLSSFMGSSSIESNADIALCLYRSLRPLTARQEKEIRAGELELTAFVRPNTMAVKCVKHRFRGPAADQVVLLDCDRGRVQDYDWHDASERDRDSEAPF